MANICVKAAALCIGLAAFKKNYMSTEWGKVRISDQYDMYKAKLEKLGFSIPTNCSDPWSEWQIYAKCPCLEICGGEDACQVVQAFYDEDPRSAEERENDAKRLEQDEKWFDSMGDDL